MKHRSWSLVFLKSDRISSPSLSSAFAEIACGWPWLRCHWHLQHPPASLTVAREVLLQYTTFFGLSFSDSRNATSVFLWSIEMFCPTRNPDLSRAHCLSNAPKLYKAHNLTERAGVSVTLSIQLYYAWLPWARHVGLGSERESSCG